jgi:hypothetical protein
MFAHQVSPLRIKPYLHWVRLVKRIAGSWSRTLVGEEFLNGGMGFLPSAIRICSSHFLMPHWASEKKKERWGRSGFFLPDIPFSGMESRPTRNRAKGLLRAAVSTEAFSIGGQ